MTNKQDLPSSKEPPVVPQVGPLRVVSVSSHSIFSADDYRRQAKILHAINRIFREALGAETEQQLGEVCLAAAEELTGSRIGFIGEIEGDILRDIASNNAGWQACAKIIPNGHDWHLPRNFKIHGLYGRVLTEGKPLLTNHPAMHPDRIGLPAGHPPLDTFLGVPLFRDEQVIGLIAMGNRPGGYTIRQQEDLEALAPAIVQVFARKRAEFRLKAEQDLLKGIIDNIPVMLCIWNPELERFTFNRELTNVLGWTLEDARDGEFISKVYPDPDYRREVMDFMQQLNVGWKDLLSTAKDGTRVDCSWANVQLPDGRGIGIGVDIRRRKQMEQELRRSEAQFKALVLASSDTIYRMSPDWTEMLYLAGERLSDAPQPVLDWENIYLLPEDQPRVLAAVQEAIRNKKLFELEHRVLHKDGTIGWTYSRAVPLLDKDGEILEWFGMASDITERIGAQQSLKEANETLEMHVARRTEEVREKAEQLRMLALQLSKAEQRERKRLARILHDHIQQLLVAARLQLGWIKTHTDPMFVYETAQEVSSILTEALDASRSLAMDLSPPVLHDAGLAAALRWLASDLRKKSQFTVHLKLDADAEPACEQTATLLFDCVREMLLNTIKHAEVTEAAVTLFRTPERFIRVMVADDGRGFKPDLLKNRRSDELTFGLFSCQQRIDQIGGRMEIQTAPDKGARITLTVPDLPGDNEAKNAKLPKIKVLRRHETPHQEGLCRVLIVDDHKIVRDGLTRLLQFESGLQVVGEAADGPTALKRAVRLRPDVLVMDVSLGKFSGIEITRRIRQWHPDIRIIGLSMHEDENIARAMLDAGAFAYLKKSGPSEDLIEKIMECLP